MFTIIEECDRKIMTWDEIKESFPDCHVALSEAQNTDKIYCSGGTVAAYSETNKSKSRIEVVKYAVNNNFYMTSTYAEQSALLTSHLIVSTYRTELGIMPDVFDPTPMTCSTADPDFDRLL